ncbi:MAG: FCD domain-containing protein [Puniceicoccales bacterium]|jgi:DNA-binding FadR family transcriptional regulator|nr:FCD domain-containing protein [Puniceicoccales bacterium]
MDAKPQVIVPNIETQVQKKPYTIGSSHRSHEVSALIEKAVVDGAYTVGQKLPSEAVLCSQYGVSRTVIREALKQLTGKGVVITRNGAGSYIAGCAATHLGDALCRIAATADESVALDLVDMWVMIEAGCIRKFVGNPGYIEKLEGFLALMHRALAIGDSETFVRADIEFHRAVIEIGGNSLMAEVHRSVDTILRKRIHRLASEGEAQRLILLEHEEVVSAVRSGDASRAAHLMMAHVQNSEERMPSWPEVKVQI